MEVTWHYASDLTDRQWQIIRPCLPPVPRRGRRRICRRRIINAILYVVRTGCQWRMLPSSFRFFTKFSGQQSKFTGIFGILCRWKRQQNTTDYC